MKRIKTTAALLCTSLLLTGCISFELPLFGGPLEQKVVMGERGPKILLLDVDGSIGLQPAASSIFGGGESMTARIRQQLDMAARDDDIEAMVLRINSPGGSAIAIGATTGWAPSSPRCSGWRLRAATTSRWRRTRSAPIRPRSRARSA